MNETTSDYIAELKAKLEAAKRRAESAEQGIEAQSNLICNIQDTCRVRDFMQRPVDEAVIALAQERDQLRARVTELEKQRDSCAKERDTQCTLKQNCISELERLREQLAALMAVAKAADAYCEQSSDHHWRTLLWSIVAAKEVGCEI